MSLLAQIKNHYNSCKYLTHHAECKGLPVSQKELHPLHSKSNEIRQHTIAGDIHFLCYNCNLLWYLYMQGRMPLNSVLVIYFVFLQEIVWK